MKNPIQRVLLIFPTEFKPKGMPVTLHLNPPLGIAYVGAVLEKAGLEVGLLDCIAEGYKTVEDIDAKMVRIGLRAEEIRERIEQFRPQAVGISSMFTMNRKNHHRVAAIVKSINPNIPVIMGGAHPTAAPHMVLEDPNVDAVVLGEGENSILPLLNALGSGAPLDDLDGIGFRRGGAVVINKKTDYVQDLDTLPFPARHLLPMEKYLSAGVYHGSFGHGGMKGRRPASLVTSRGCPYRCNFCTAFEVFTRRPRTRSVNNVMAEVDDLITRYGATSFFFEDDQFIAKRQHTEELLDALADRQRRYGITWDTPNGVSAWLLNERILTKMKASGCVRVSLAVESGNQFVLDNIIHKPVRLEGLPSLVRQIRDLGMDAHTFIVVGNIGEQNVETLDQVRDSFRLARRLNVHPHVSYLTPYPGSEVLDIAQRKGYLIPGFDWDKLTITEQSLTTPEWTPEALRTVVEEEKILTNLWFKLTNPKAWLQRFLPLLRGQMRENPLGVPSYYARRALEIAGLLASALFHRLRWRRKSA